MPAVAAVLRPHAPIERAFQQSRLERQLLSAAYELTVPPIRRRAVPADPAGAAGARRARPGVFGPAAEGRCA